MSCAWLVHLLTHTSVLTSTLKGTHLHTVTLCPYLDDHPLTHIPTLKMPYTKTVHRRDFNFYFIVCMGVLPECM